MLAFTIRRIFVSIPVLLVSTFVVFLLTAWASNPYSDLEGRHPAPPRSEFLLRKQQLHLDQNLVHRYFTWLGGILHGNFGYSVRWHDRVGSELAHRIGVTLRMVIAALILAAFFAIITGVVSAVKQYTVTDYSLTFAGFLFLSLPTFWFALILKELAIKINEWSGSRIFDTIGDQSVDPKHGFAHYTDLFSHLVLPTITLALISYAAWSRFGRASMLEVLNSDYIRLARAKGLSRRRVMVRHALRTALIPLTTVMAIDFAGLLAGAVITETIFQWHAMGEFGTDAVRQGDTSSLLAWLLVTAFLVVVFNLIADLMYAVLDPRIRYA